MKSKPTFYKCNCDLFLKGGIIRSFTKGKIYKQIQSTDRLTLRDDNGAHHEVEGWEQHFELVNETSHEKEKK